MRVGDKVVCINDRIDPDKLEEIKNDFENWIVKNEVYTIREILDNDGIVPALLLEEVHNFPKFFKLMVFRCGGIGRRDWVFSTGLIRCIDS